MIPEGKNFLTHFGSKPRASGDDPELEQYHALPEQ